jgi:hypothetical protein
MGEADMRSNILGDGTISKWWKNWNKSGLDKADAIANIEVHPLMLTLFCSCNGKLLNLIRNAVFTAHKTVENMAISSSKDENGPCVFVSILQS